MMNKHTQRILRATIVILVLLLASVIFLLLTDKNKTETKYDQLPWYLTLVNKTHLVPKTYIPELCKLANGEQIDRRIYPELQENKTEETGFQYERWHYRYVGTDSAQLIHEEHLTLKEYLQIYE